MCIIIAEAGENHLGDMEIAKKLIDLAYNAGADYVKFQYYNAEDCADSDPEKIGSEKYSSMWKNCNISMIIRASKELTFYVRPGMYKKQKTSFQ